MSKKKVRAKKASGESKTDARADQRRSRRAAAVAVHKHEANMHKGWPKTKLPK